MKALFTTLAFAGIILTSSAQYNSELIDTTKIWSTVDSYTAGGGIMYSYYNKFGGDTIINIFTWTKIFRAYDEFMTEWELQGFVREDNNKFYFRNLNNEVGLAYDFDASVGDTVHVTNPFAFYDFQAEVLEIDSVSIEPANENRKRIQLELLEYPWIIESWIEGIGSDAGLVVSGCKMGGFTGSSVYSLLCYFENEELMYKMEGFPVCFYPSVGIPDNDMEKVDYSIIPNPVTNTSHLIVQNPENKKLSIRIFNSFGQLVKQYNYNTSIDMEIRTGDFPAGVYFYSIYENNDFLTSDKFIIQ